MVEKHFKNSNKNCHLLQGQNNLKEKTRKRYGVTYRRVLRKKLPLNPEPESRQKPGSADAWGGLET